MSPLVAAPPLVHSHEESWHALLELARRVPEGWTVVGGQMTHLHVWERGGITARPTDDGDAGLDVRTDPKVVERVSTELAGMGFRPHMASPDGPQVRWATAEATIDLLVPVGTGARRVDAAGRPILASHGIQQALDRTSRIRLRVADDEGRCRARGWSARLWQGRGALSNDDPRPARHLQDLAVLLHLLQASDLDLDPLRSRDGHHLRPALDRLQDPLSGVHLTPESRVALAVLQREAQF